MRPPSLPQTSPSLFRTWRGAPTIRRFGYLLPVAIITAALLVAMAPADADARSRMKLGVSGAPSGVDLRDIDTVKAFSQTVSTAAGTSSVLKPATWTIWSTWGNPATKEFPTAFAKELRAYGVTPMVWWEPMRDREHCAFAVHKKIAKGRYDKYIKRWARNAKAYGSKVIVRYSHEINGGYFPWTVKRCGNTAYWYKKGWRHVYNVVRNKVGAKNVKFLWTVAKQRRPKGVANQYKKFYPGNRYVQFAGYSSFNWGNEDGKQWIPMIKGIDDLMRYIPKFTRKPIIVAELATNEVGGSKPDWIRDGYVAAYQKYPQIKGVTYLNVDLTHVGHPNWSLYSPSPGAMNAYADIASQLRFQGHY